MHRISQWVTQNPKATITSQAAAALPKLLSAIPDVVFVGNSEQRAPDPTIYPRKQLLAGPDQGNEQIGFQHRHLLKYVSGNPLGGQWNKVGEGSDITKFKTLSEGKPAHICVYSWILKSLLDI